MADIVRHNPDRKLSDAVEYNGIVYLAGQVAEKLNVGMKEQTQDVLRQIDALLAKCGTNKSRILTATVYVILPVTPFPSVAERSADRQRMGRLRRET